VTNWIAEDELEIMVGKGVQAQCQLQLSVGRIRASGIWGWCDRSCYGRGHSWGKMNRMKRQIIVWILLLLGNGSRLAFGELRAGAARVEITPAASAHLPIWGYDDPPPRSEGVHDPLHVRALVFDDGKQRAAIVSCEVLLIPNLLWQDAARRISTEAGIPGDNLMLVAVHNHAGPVLETKSDDKTVMTPYAQTVVNGIVEAVLRASEKLKPARVGFGAGKADLNVNRRARMAGGGYWIGVNPDGPSDKTVGVVKVEDLSGHAIAVVINYAVHCVMLGYMNREISADLAGATSNFVEHQLGDPVVALWTSGAAGDQNPTQLNLVSSDFDAVAAYGMYLGEEVVRIAQNVRSREPRHVQGRQRAVSCPGQQVAPGNLPRDKYEFRDADPVPVRLSLLMIGNTVLAGVSGEPFTRVWQQLKTQAPFSHLLMLTHCNGTSGYLPDAAAYEQVSYEIATSHVKRGCAETSVVDGLLAMMDEY